MEGAFEVLKMKFTSAPVLAFRDFEQHIIVEAGASSGAFGNVSSQKKRDGRLYPDQFTTRTMIISERSYSAWER